MDGFRNHFHVDIHDVDPSGIARTSAILRYMQSCAELQLTDAGMPYSTLRDKHRAFILSRIHLECTAPLRAHEPVTALTSPCESRGYSFLRFYGLERDGEPIARAAAIFALIDTQTRGLIKVEDFNLPLPLMTNLPLAIDHIRLPNAMHEIGSYPVLYDDADQNGHMNNTRYADLYAAYLPMNGFYIKSLTVSYLNEAPLGDILKVERGEEEANGMRTYFFRTTRGDGKINTQAQIALAPL